MYQSRVFCFFFVKQKKTINKFNLNCQVVVYIERAVTTLLINYIIKKRVDLKLVLHIYLISRVGKTAHSTGVCANSLLTRAFYLLGDLLKLPTCPSRDSYARETVKPLKYEMVQIQRATLFPWQP